MEELRKKIAELINNSELPFECKYYVLKDVFNEVNNLYRELLKQQQEQQNIQEVNDERIEENIDNEGKTE